MQLFTLIHMLALAGTPGVQAVNDNAVSYHPINLLDGNPTTLWCAHFRDGGVNVQLTLQTPQPVDMVAITAAGRGGKRVERIRVSRDGEGRDAQFDQEATAEVNFPMARTRIINLSVRSVATSGVISPLGSDVFCLADVTLYYQNEPLDMSDVSVLPQHLTEQVVGSWQRELGKMHPRLTFNLDGTWSLQSQGRGNNGKLRIITGKYELANDRVVLHRSGKKAARFVAHVETVQIQGADDETVDAYSILFVRGTGDLDGKYVVRGTRSSAQALNE